MGSYCGAGVGAPSSASPAVGAAGLVSDSVSKNRGTPKGMIYNGKPY